MRKASAVLSAALLAGTSAWAQTVQPAPVRQSVDANGVDLFLGTLNVSREDISMGDAQSGMSYSRTWRGGFYWMDNYDIHLFQDSSSSIVVAIGKRSVRFVQNGGTFNVTDGSPGTLTQSGNQYTFIDKAGSIYQFDKSASYTAQSTSDIARVTSIVRPDGMTLIFSYDNYTICLRKNTSGQDLCAVEVSSGRLRYVTSSLGFKLAYSYVSSDTRNFVDTDFFSVSRVAMTNLANSVVQQASYTNRIAASDMAGRAWNYQVPVASGNITDIQPPGRGYDVHVDYYSGNNFVSAYRNAAGVTTSYVYNDGTDSDGSSIRTTYVQVGGNPSSRAVFDLNTQLMKRSVDENGLTTSYEHDGYGRLTKVTAPDGNSVEYTYDGRGNVTQTTAHRKAGDNRGDSLNLGVGFAF